MRRILICAPSQRLQRQLEELVSGFGHEPILARAPGPVHMVDADVLIFELSDPIGVATAQAVRSIDSLLPLIAVGPETPLHELEELDVELVAALFEPITAEELHAAIGLALRR